MATSLLAATSSRQMPHTCALLPGCSSSTKREMPAASFACAARGDGDGDGDETAPGSLQCVVTHFMMSHGMRTRDVPCLGPCRSCR